jgi:hypothetical protein
MMLKLRTRNLQINIVWTLQWWNQSLELETRYGYYDVM